MRNPSAFLYSGGAGSVKSVQRVLGRMTAGNTSANITVSSVDMNNCIARIGAEQLSGTGSIHSVNMRLTKTNSTTLTIERSATDAGSASPYLTIELVEYYPGVLKSNQIVNFSGTIGVNQPTWACSAVDIAKSVAYGQGATVTGGAPTGTNTQYLIASYEFLSTTSIQSPPAASGGTQWYQGSGTLAARLNVAEFN